MKSDWLKLIALVVPLGIDTFAMAAALGVAGLTRENRLRVSTLFTCFEAGMPLVGLLVGRVVSGAIGGVSDWIAAAVLVAVGLFMVMSRGDDDKAGELLARTNGIAVIGLGLSISLDELAIGFTLGLVGVPVVAAVALIAAQAFILSQAGLRLGSRIGEAFREGTEKVAGLALVVVGLGLAVSHLAGIRI